MVARSEASTRRDKGHPLLDRRLGQARLGTVDTFAAAPARGRADLLASRSLLVGYYLLPDAWQGERSVPVESELPRVLREEADGLPGRFAPPAGEVLLARGDHAPIGVLLLGPTATADTCELKRLRVVERARGRGVARALVTQALDLATAAGYRTVAVDVLPWRTAAIRLYEDIGFSHLDEPAINPHRLRYMRLDLGR